MSSPDDLSALAEWVVPWCEAALGARPVRVLLHLTQMSEVFGLALDDGRSVAMKARPDEGGRLASCLTAQAVCADRGFACARPLTGLVPLGGPGIGLAIHAEEWRPGGEMLRGDQPAVARRYATVFADLMATLASVRVPPPLPNPYWLRWRHDGPGLWPRMGFLDSRDQRLVPSLVSETTARATVRLRENSLPNVLGHADFEAQNLRWTDNGRRIWAVHDWDSLAWMPEAALVGAASGAFASDATPTLAPIESSAAFLDAYQEHRSRAFTREEIEVAWAASLWPATHNARAQALFERAPVALTALENQARERLRLAGA